MHKTGLPIFRMGVVPGPPYLFACRRCKHRFTRRIRWGLCCPRCLTLSPLRVPILK